MLKTPNEWAAERGYNFRLAVGGPITDLNIAISEQAFDALLSAGGFPITSVALEQP